MMKRAGLLLGLVWMAAGCEPGKPPAPPGPPANPAGSGLPTGLPGSASRAMVSGSTWSAGGRTVRATIEGQRASDAKTSLFRSTIPFPQTTWSAGPFEVTQLVYPAGAGFVARYQVMNHGDEPARGTLAVDGLETPLRFPLDVATGSALFFNVTTPDLTSVPEGALEAGIQAWEKALGGRTIQVPDAELMTRYHLAAAGLAHAGEDAALHARLFKVEGDAIRLVPDLPEAWRKETVEARALPTPFGPLTFAYSGAFENVSIELDGTCKPPGGFLLAVAPKSKSKVDGADAAPAEGLLKAPSGARRIEVFKPLE